MSVSSALRKMMENCAQSFSSYHPFGLGQAADNWWRLSSAFALPYLKAPLEVIDRNWSVQLNWNVGAFITALPVNYKAELEFTVERKRRNLITRAEEPFAASMRELQSRLINNWQVGQLITFSALLLLLALSHFVYFFSVAPNGISVPSFGNRFLSPSPTKHRLMYSHKCN